MESAVSDDGGDVNKESDGVADLMQHARQPVDFSNQVDWSHVSPCCWKPRPLLRAA